MAGDGGGWDEDAHPRGPDGRFGGGGSDLHTWATARATGAGRDTTKASTRDAVQKWAAAQGDQRAEKAKSEKEKASAPKRDWTGVRMTGASKETWQDHYVDKDGNKGTPGARPDEGGKPSAERAAMHEREFIAPAFAGKKTADELGMQKHAILTMGGPASGKGTILSKLKEGGLDRTRYVHIDPDEVKGKLPEYTSSVPHPEHTDRHGERIAGTGGKNGDGTGPTFRGAAAQVHEESSAVAKQIEAKAIASGHNVIIDGTGANTAGMKERIKKLEDAGYRVDVHHAHLDPAEGVRRASGRAEHSGRDVPVPVIQGTYDKIEKSMDSVHAAAKNLTIYDGHNKHAEVYERKNGVEPSHGMSPREAIAKAREPKFRIRSK